MMRRVCVFCGSRPGRREAYRLAAAEVGRLLAHRGMELVYGGGQVGLMGVLADAVLQAGGRVIGVIPDALAARELAHRGIQDLRIVTSMHARKALMADLADGFMALPGGVGTFEEFCEILTWAQLGLQAKPCGLLNVAGYYDPLLALFDRAIKEEFAPGQQRDWILEHTEPAALLDCMARFTPPAVEKWISAAER